LDRALGIAIAQSDSKPSGTSPPARQAAAAPKVIALTFYADWCPGCKALAPKLKEVMESSAAQPCLFVKLDQTAKESHQAEYMLAALRLGDLWKEHGGTTGFVLLVDAKTRKVVSTLTADQDTRSMQAALASAVRG
jgi:thiol-disulfide isomerase/thioredoxin